MSSSKDWSVKNSFLALIGIFFFFYNSPLIFALFIFKASGYELYRYNPVDDKYHLAEHQNKFYILLSIASTIIYFIVWIYIKGQVFRNV